MRADNSHHLVAAARRRSGTTRDKATRALDRLVRDRQQVTFDTVARAAAVSRAWLYADPELRARIGQLRATSPPAPPSRPAAAVRASDASLLRRLELAQQSQRRLRADNDRLRRDLAAALGLLRRHGLSVTPP